MTKKHPAPPHYPVTLSPEESRLRINAVIDAIDRMIAGEFLPFWVTNPAPDQVEAAQAFLANPPAASKHLVDALLASRAGDHHDNIQPDHNPRAPGH